MVYGFGLLVALAGFAGFLLWRGRLAASPRFLRIAAWAWPLPFLANSAGWVITEMGRQPWIVQGLLRTDGAQSPTVSSLEVWITLLGFTVLYAVLGAIALWIMRREAREGLERRAAAAARRRTRPLARLLRPRDGRVHHPAGRLVRAHRGPVDRLLRARGLRLRRRDAAARDRAHERRAPARSSTRSGRCGTATRSG